MTFKNARDNLTSLFNDRLNNHTGIALRSGAKGASVGMQILSVGLKAGFLAAATPLAAAAIVGAGALVAGGVVAYGKFKKLSDNAAEKAQRQPIIVMVLNPPRPQLQPA